MYSSRLFMLYHLILCLCAWFSTDGLVAQILRRSWKALPWYFLGSCTLWVILNCFWSLYWSLLINHQDLIWKFIYLYLRPSSGFLIALQFFLHTCCYIYMFVRISISEFNQSYSMQTDSNGWYFPFYNLFNKGRLKCSNNIICY